MQVLKVIVVGIVVVLGLLIAWGVLIEPRFLLEENLYEVEMRDLPESWEGTRVAFIADKQVGMWFDNIGMIEKVVDRIVTLDPDLVLIGGDFVYHPDPQVIEKAVQLMQPLVDGDREVYAVLGNHDYSMASRKTPPNTEMANLLERRLEEIGIQVLENESVRLGDRDPLHLVGIGSVWADRARPEKALSQVPEDEARLVLAHNPVIFRDMPPYSASLMLSGHTHGGQIRIPFLESWSWLHIAESREVVADRWAEKDIGAAGNRLYVNRGIGFSNVPVRINCRPELSIFTLTGAAGTVPARGE